MRLRSGPKATHYSLKSIYRESKKSLERFYGTPPQAKVIGSPPTRPDYTALKMYAVDDLHVHDREDLISAEFVGENVVLRVAFIDVSWFVKPGNAFDEYAEKVGATIYGSNISVTTLGTEIARNDASFITGKPRPAWIVETKIRPDGTVISRSITWGIVKCAAHIAPRTVSEMVNSENPEEWERYRCGVCEASRRKKTTFKFSARRR